MTTQILYALSAALVALALLVLGAALVRQEWQRNRGSKVLGRAIARGQADASSEAVNLDEPILDLNAQGLRDPQDLPVHWLEGRLGRLFVAEEDRQLMAQCGWPLTRAQLIFLAWRLALVVMLPTLVLLLGQVGIIKSKVFLLACFGFVLGFLLPKWVLSALASKKRERVEQELPLFIDLLRLLQGVGLSLDQSTQIMATEFRHVLKVLGRELEIANSQYMHGRSREHSLQRLATVFNNDNLAGLVELLVQVDRHGGAVQEPLKQYSERLREHRRATMKERIGKTTVKMTAVMVTTLLPALIIVTAGPGFLAVIRSLGAMNP